MTAPDSQPTFRALTKIETRVKVVDIGANPIDGTPPYAGLLARGEADVVGFEPNPDALDRLNAQKGRNETYLPHAIGDGGTHTLHVCQAPGMTSLLTPNPAVLGCFHGFPDWGRVVATRTVDTMRLDDVPETIGVDLLKIDIQGAELMAFRNGQDRLRDAVVVQTEVEFMPLYVDQPLFSDVDRFLREQGFMLHRFFPIVSRVIRPVLLNNNIYEGMSQSVWADAIFVKDFTKLDRLSDRQMLVMAKIMHDCYRSVDLCAHLLVEYDRRNGTGTCQAYLSAIQAHAVPLAA